MAKIGGARAAAKRALALDALPPMPNDRTRHGVVVRQARLVHNEAAPVIVWQGLDTLAIMLSRNTITEPMKQAGDRFHDLFRRAGLDSLHGADPTRVRGAGRWHEGGDEAATLQVRSALDALSGATSPTGSCSWFVLGCEWSLRRWASERSGWETRPLNVSEATGILIAALSILRKHMGF